MLLGIFILLLSIASWASAESDPVSPPDKGVVALRSFENKSRSRLGSEWNFLKREEGPSDDPVSNGLMHQLVDALAQNGQPAIIGERGVVSQPLTRGLPGEISRGPELTSPSQTPRVLVYCSATLDQGQVTIEVRLINPQTKKLIKAETFVGTPEDLKVFLKESSAEQVVHEAIRKAAAWIGENTLQSVIIKASVTYVKEYPSLQSATLATVRQGTRLIKEGEEAGWIKVKLESGETGWVYGKLVE
jgi:uncharacterized protein YgiM (DUF1202 family)